MLLYQPQKQLGKVLQVTAGDGAPRELTVQLQPCAMVRGRLVDQKQQPITGARIRVAPLPGGDFSPQLNPIATDAEGRFEHKGVLPGARYNVMSESVRFGFKTLAEKIDVASGETIDLGTIDLSWDQGKPSFPKGLKVSSTKSSVTLRSLSRDQRETHPGYGCGCIPEQRACGPRSCSHIRR